MAAPQQQLLDLSNKSLVLQVIESEIHGRCIRSSSGMRSFFRPHFRNAQTNARNLFVEQNQSPPLLYGRGEEIAFIRERDYLNDYWYFEEILTVLL